MIHSDVSGLISVKSLGDSHYYVSFIDEFARYIAVVSIANKIDVIVKFKRFHAWFERKFGCKIKALHCNAGGEYVACEGYLQAQVIERHLIPPYTLEINALAERVNRTLMKSARTMLYHASMPPEWEAVVHAADKQNRFICSRSSSKTH